LIGKFFFKGALKGVEKVQEIRLAQIEDLDQIRHLLNETTLQLKQKGIEQWDYPWDHQKIAKQISNGYVYVLLLNEEIIGSFCMNDIEKINDLTVEPKSIYLSQIAISPEYQGKNLGRTITDYTCSFVKKINKTLYLDCWAGNEKLKEFYSNNGLQYIGDFPEENYFISIFKYK
jgi:ribosomal protein S18 acetylase RimI-like enzyme